jgi:hypothetical protein
MGNLLIDKNRIVESRPLEHREWAWCYIYANMVEAGGNGEDKGGADHFVAWGEVGGGLVT